MTILFDSARPVKPRRFAAGLAEPTAWPLMPSQMAHIDRVRADAYADACRSMPEAEAAEYAGDVAQAEYNRLIAVQAASRAASRERRKPYSVADANWWAAANGEAEFELAAGAALCTARMSAGFPIL